MRERRDAKLNFDMPIEKAIQHFLLIKPSSYLSERDREMDAFRAYVLANRAYLSAIVLCGSVLEGVLLGAAKKDPEKFNRSPASPLTLTAR